MKRSAAVGTNTAVRHIKPIIGRAIKTAGKILKEIGVGATVAGIIEGVKAIFNEITNHNHNNSYGAK